MNVENFWKQLKHKNLHHILHPRLDQLVWILIHEVVPTYIVRIEELRSTSRLGTSKALSPFQKSFKSDWKTLARRVIPSSKYTHLVQAVHEPNLHFFQQVIRRRVYPFYKHPQLVLKGEPHGNFSKAEDGSFTDGDDQDWLGDSSQLTDGAWRGLFSSSQKRRRSSAFSESATRSPSPSLLPTDSEFDSSTQNSRPISSLDYGSEDEQELDQLVEKAQVKVQQLRRAADLIEAQLPYRNFTWLKGLHDRKLGRDIGHFVEDIASFEDSRGARPTTWASSSSKTAKRQERNTLGYQVQKD
ncbi:hypothetical protein D9758_012134 [Tetrapyrgos nigripes]|uniref:Uncharacterized protein n=1 Tax=Tetrapyrgos nigripes TaxID=182062 RepID=A0A8H5FP29_9AGAR|nr:hypothetical protein D9758_012134 [Tetrapyrgos nigripes]